MYFLIRNGDGDTTVHICETPEMVLEYVNPDGGLPCIGYHELVGMNKDTNYWAGRYLIIKGEVVTPKPLEKVTTWELE